VWEVGGQKKKEIKRFKLANCRRTLGVEDGRQVRGNRDKGGSFAKRRRNKN